MTNPTEITLTIERPNLDDYSRRQLNADVFCVCCGRGIPNRETAQVAIVAGTNGAEVTFGAIGADVMGRDSVEWGCFVGSHCAKRLPKTHKVSQRRARSAWVKNGCP